MWNLINFFVTTTIFILITISLCAQNHVVSAAATAAAAEKGGGWDGSLTLDKNKGIVVTWNVSHEGQQQWLDMEVSAMTRGYIGLGFSSNGAMRGSDIVVAWVDDSGQGHLRDLHGTGNEQPELDSEQNYVLIRAEEGVQGTKIWFRRPLDTCDHQDDMPITAATMRLIWAVGERDPVTQRDDPSQITFDYHHAHGRGVKSVYLLTKPLLAQFPDENPQKMNDSTTKYWDLVMSDNQVDAEETSYFCKIVKFPNLEKKHHMIGYRPIITPANLDRVHHICMYECIVPEDLGGTEATFEKHTVHEGGRCYTPNMPPEWTIHCMTFLTCWVYGSEGEMYPHHLGHPMGEQHGGASYYMLELHYHNPELLTFKDSSGLRIFYDEPRENDANVLLVYHRVTPFQYIPPHQKEFKSIGICTSECTQMTIPPDGINLVSVLHHAHKAGQKIRLRHFRKGTELAKISEDNSYDFNYQQTRALEKEVKVLPGDDLVVECDYSTMDRNTSLLGGLAATQEMCAIFIMYYPPMELGYCASQSEFHDFFNAVGIQDVQSKVFAPMNLPYDPFKWSKEKQKIDPPDNVRELEAAGEGQSFTDIFDLMSIQKPEKLRNVTVSNYLTYQVDWRDEKWSKSVQKGWTQGRQYAYCTAHGRKRIPIKNFIVKYPHIDQPFVDPVQTNCAALKEKQWSSSSSAGIFLSQKSQKSFYHILATTFFTLFARTVLVSFSS